MAAFILQPFTLQQGYRILAILVCVWLLCWIPPSIAQEQPVHDATTIEYNDWLIQPIHVKDSQAYYQAYMGSIDFLYKRLGWAWPTRKISPEMNAEMVKEQAAQEGGALIYVIRHQAVQGILGTLYINPVNTQRRYVANFDPYLFHAEVSLWFVEKAHEQLDIGSFFEGLQAWFIESGDFSRVLLPINQSYTELYQPLEDLGLAPFTVDKQTGEKLYRLL